jgi:hypothetical protein
LQPWKYAVDIDRFDFEQVNRKIFHLWFTAAKTGGLLRRQANQFRRLPVLFNYTVLFEHPDPGKRAQARATDLQSGASTLTKTYADQGLNARREIEKDCKLMGITKERYFEMTLQKRYDLIDAHQTSQSQGDGEDSQQGQD